VLANPDPTFHFDVYSKPALAPQQRDAKLRKLFHRSFKAPFWASMPPSWASKAFLCSILSLYSSWVFVNADPNLAFDFDLRLWLWSWSRRIRVRLFTLMRIQIRNTVFSVLNIPLLCLCFVSHGCDPVNSDPHWVSAPIPSVLNIPLLCSGSEVPRVWPGEQWPALGLRPRHPSQYRPRLHRQQAGDNGLNYILTLFYQCTVVLSFLVWLQLFPVFGIHSDPKLLAWSGIISDTDPGKIPI
jgi:hypothetical protein